MSNQDMSFSSAFASFSKSLKPLSTTLSQNILQATQYTREKLGALPPQDVTELPHEYTLLAAQVDSLRLTYDMLGRVARNYEAAQYDYAPEITDRASDMANSISTNATLLASKISGAVSPGSHPVETPPSLAHPVETPPSLAHAFAKASQNASILLGKEAPFGFVC